MTISKKKRTTKKVAQFQEQKKRTPKKPKSQEQRILEYLQKGKSLTQRQAVNMWECYRLSGRIHSLRKRGYKIVTDMKPNKKNNGTHASYRLEK